MVRPSRFATSASMGPGTTAKGLPSTMLVKRFRTCTGESAVSSPRETCAYTPTRTAILMVDAAWNRVSALNDHCSVVWES